jgi:hypothetical protein
MFNKRSIDYPVATTCSGDFDTRFALCKDFFTTHLIIPHFLNKQGSPILSPASQKIAFQL